MIHKDCGYFTGDDDCNSCVIKGYFSSCDGCNRYEDNSPKDPIDVLYSRLKKKNIPVEIIKKRFEPDIEKELAKCHNGCAADKWQRNQLIYGREKSRNHWKLDAIWQFGSYGREQGKLEVWGDMIGDEPVVMSVDEVFDMIVNDYRGDTHE